MFCAAPTSTAAYSGVRPMAARDGSRGPENSTREKKITPGGGRAGGGGGGGGEKGKYTRAQPGTRRHHAGVSMPTAAALASQAGKAFPQVRTAPPAAQAHCCASPVISSTVGVMSAAMPQPNLSKTQREMIIMVKVCRGR